MNVTRERVVQEKALWKSEKCKFGIEFVKEPGKEVYLRFFKTEGPRSSALYGIFPDEDIDAMIRLLEESKKPIAP